MLRFVGMALLVSAPAFAQSSEALRDCQPIGQTVKGELIYGLDCKAITTDGTVAEYKPDMPPTNMKETVIPKPGKVQNPDTTPTKGETR